MMGIAPAKVFGEEARRILCKQVYITASGKRELATFAGGCFWGLQLALSRVPGVISTEVGYTQGKTKNPTYEDVCAGFTGHAEAVQVTFDSHAIRFEDLLVIFWDFIDPTTLNKQGNDIGTQYRSGIYYHSESQFMAALSSKKEQQHKWDDVIVTEILPSKEWYKAEEYHQDYLAKGGQCSKTGDVTTIRCYG